MQQTHPVKYAFMTFPHKISELDFSQNIVQNDSSGNVKEAHSSPIRATNRNSICEYFTVVGKTLRIC